MIRISRRIGPILSLIVLAGTLRASASFEGVDIEALLDHHASAHGFSRDEPLEGARHVVADLEAFGLTGQLESWSEHPLRNWTRLELGPLVLETGYDGSHGWIRDRNGLLRRAEGAEENGMLLEALFETGGYLLHRPPVALRRSLIAITDSTVTLRIHPLLGEPETLLLDAHSHRLLESRWHSGQFDERTIYEDYAWMSGILVPQSMRLQLGDDIEFRAKLLSFERGHARGAEFYRMPEEEERNQVQLSQSGDSGRIPMVGTGRHILLHGSIGDESGNFLLDSGAGSNVIHAGHLDRLGLAALGAVEALGVAGSAQAAFVDIAEVDLRGLRLLQQNWMSLDFRELEFALGHPLLGVLGYDTFFQLITHVHYGERWVRFYQVDQFDAPEDAIPLPLRLDANVPTIEVVIEGIPAWVHVDTGSDNTLDLARPFVESHNLLKDRGDLGESGVLGLGGVGKSQKGALRNFSMGPFEYDDFTAYFHEEGDGIFENRSVAGILGAGVLADFECWFDYSRQTLWLRSLADTGR